MPFFLLPFCFPHFLMISPWKENKQRGSQGRRQDSHTYRSRKAKIRSDGWQFNTVSELSSPVLLLYAKQNCHTLSILKMDERVQKAKPASSIFYVCKARLQNVAQSCLWAVQAKCGSSGKLLGFPTRVPEEFWGFCPRNSWLINKTQSQDLHSLIYFNDL